MWACWTCLPEACEKKNDHFIYLQWNRTLYYLYFQQFKSDSHKVMFFVLSGQILFSVHKRYLFSWLPIIPTWVNWGIYGLITYNEMITRNCKLPRIQRQVYLNFLLHLAYSRKWLFSLKKVNEHTINNHRLHHEVFVVVRRDQTFILSWKLDSRSNDFQRPIHGRMVIRRLVV